MNVDSERELFNAFKQMPNSQKERFMKTLEKLIANDQTPTVEEFRKMFLQPADK